MTTFTVVLEKRAAADKPWRVVDMDHHESGFTMERFRDSMQVLHSEWIKDPDHRVMIHQWAEFE